jgi:hypothetical protein
MIDIDKIERLLQAGVSHSADIAALIAEVRALRETIKRQASAARMGMDAAKAGGAIMLELATQARAESSPDVLASERAMNAVLTEENEALRQELGAWQSRFPAHVYRPQDECVANRFWLERRQPDEEPK